MNSNDATKEGSYNEHGQKHGYWVDRNGMGNPESVGEYVDGKKHGYWYEVDGSRGEEGEYVDGEKHGHWIERHTDGYFRLDILGGRDKKCHLSVETGEWVETQKGKYWKGRRDGKWVEEKANGILRAEGSYFRGNKEGHWSELYVDESNLSWPKSEFIESHEIHVVGPYVDEREKDGACFDGDSKSIKDIWRNRLIEGKGTYYNNKKNGLWFFRYMHGKVQEGPFVDGKRHGLWVFRSPSSVLGSFASSVGYRVQMYDMNVLGGSMEVVPYVNGKRHGHWIQWQGERVKEGPAVDGKKHGHWIERDGGGNILREGYYVRGKKRGHWIERSANGTTDEGTYVKGKKHGWWTRRSAEGDVTKSKYQNGILVSMQKAVP